MPGVVVGGFRGCGGCGLALWEREQRQSSVVGTTTCDRRCGASLRVWFGSPSEGIFWQPEMQWAFPVSPPLLLLQWPVLWYSITFFFFGKDLELFHAAGALITPMPNTCAMNSRSGLSMGWNILDTFFVILDSYGTVGTRRC